MVGVIEGRVVVGSMEVGSVGRNDGWVDVKDVPSGNDFSVVVSREDGPVGTVVLNNAEVGSVDFISVSCVAGAADGIDVFVSVGRNDGAADGILAVLDDVGGYMGRSSV